MSNPKVYYIVVYTTNNGPVIEGGQVPVFWHRKTAKEHFKSWKNVKVVRCTIDIWPQ